MAEISTDNVEFSPEEATAFYQAVADGTNENVTPDESTDTEPTVSEDAGVTENAVAGQFDLPTTWNNVVVRLFNVANQGDCASQQPNGPPPDNLPVWTWKYDPKFVPNSHRFTLHHVNGYWYLVNKYTGGNLYMRNSGVSAITTKNLTDWCLFKVHTTDNGQTYTLTSKKNPTLRLDVNGGSNTKGKNGIKIQAWPKNDSDAQKWQVKRV